ncbi:hypothetical protein NIES22_57570 [Calothrix brevissima NIES-22]|nr:hypothetical protein NIES22_57570 [Calothrix brevissima NIES-22]
MFNCTPYIPKKWGEIGEKSVRNWVISVWISKTQDLGKKLPSPQAPSAGQNNLVHARIGVGCTFQ